MTSCYSYLTIPNIPQQKVVIKNYIKSWRTIKVDEITEEQAVDFLKILREFCGFCLAIHISTYFRFHDQNFYAVNKKKLEVDNWRRKIGVWSYKKNLTFPIIVDLHVCGLPMILWCNFSSNFSMRPLVFYCKFPRLNIRDLEATYAYDVSYSVFTSQTSVIRMTPS